MSWAAATPSASPSTRAVTSSSGVKWPRRRRPGDPAGREVNRARAAGFSAGRTSWATTNRTASTISSRGKTVRFSTHPNNTGRAICRRNHDLVSLHEFARSFRSWATAAHDRYPADTRLPDYYNGKLITYDWMRGWMMAVTLDSLGNFSRMEPFADSIKLSRPMDMFLDKNGSLWVLDYGTQWFSSNPDARISRIDYVRGNRPPHPRLEADKVAAAAPMTVVLASLAITTTTN